MRKSHIVVSILTFLGLAALIGLHVFASCVLAMGIVASYGTSMRILLGRAVGRTVAATITSMTLALITLTIGVGLVFLWSLTLQQPFLPSLSLWSAIFGGGATWALVAMGCEEQGHELKALRAIYE